MVAHAAARGEVTAIAALDYKRGCKGSGETRLAGGEACRAARDKVPDVVSQEPVCNSPR